MNEREAFEAWITGKWLPDRRLDLAWEAWQARAALAQPAVKGEPVAHADHGVLNWVDGEQFNEYRLLYTQPTAQPAQQPDCHLTTHGKDHITPPEPASLTRAQRVDAVMRHVWASTSKHKRIAEIEAALWAALDAERDAAVTSVQEQKP